MLMDSNSKQKLEPDLRANSVFRQPYTMKIIHLVGYAYLLLLGIIGAIVMPRAGTINRTIV